MGAGAAKAARSLDNVEPEQAVAIMTAVQAFDASDPFTVEQLNDLEFFKKRILKASKHTNPGIESSVAKLTKADLAKFNQYLRANRKESEIKPTVAGEQDYDSPDNMSVLSYEDESDIAEFGSKDGRHHGTSKFKSQVEDLEVQNLEFSHADLGGPTTGKTHPFNEHKDSTDDDGDSPVQVKIHPSGSIAVDGASRLDGNQRIKRIKQHRDATNRRASRARGHGTNRDVSEDESSMNSDGDGNAYFPPIIKPATQSMQQQSSSDLHVPNTTNMVKLLSSAVSDDPQHSLHQLLGTKHSGIVGLQKTKVWSYAHNAQLEREVEQLQKQLEELEALEKGTVDASPPHQHPSHRHDNGNGGRPVGSVAPSRPSHGRVFNHFSEGKENGPDGTNEDDQSGQSIDLRVPSKPRRRRARANHHPVHQPSSAQPGKPILQSSYVIEDDELDSSIDVEGATTAQGMSNSVSSTGRMGGLGSHLRVNTNSTTESGTPNDSTSVGTGKSGTRPRVSQSGTSDIVSPRGVGLGRGRLEAIEEQDDTAGISPRNNQGGDMGHDGNHKQRSDTSALSSKLRRGPGQRPRRRQSQENAPTGSTAAGVAVEAESPDSELDRGDQNKFQPRNSRHTQSDSENDSVSNAAVVPKGGFGSTLAVDVESSHDTIAPVGFGNGNANTNRESAKRLLKNLNQRRVHRDTAEEQSATEGSIDVEESHVGPLVAGSGGIGTGIRTGGINGRLVQNQSNTSITNPTKLSHLGRNGRGSLGSRVPVGHADDSDTGDEVALAAAARVGPTGSHAIHPLDTSDTDGVGQSHASVYPSESMQSNGNNSDKKHPSSRVSRLKTKEPRPRPAQNSSVGDATGGGKKGTPWTDSLDSQWGEVSFILRKPIVSEADMLYTIAAAEAGLMFTDQLNEVAKSLQVLRGTLSRWLLPYDHNTRIDEQCSTPHSVVAHMPDSLKGRMTERQIHYLVAGVNSVRRLVRVKIADDNDLDQARRALKTTVDFFKDLQEAATAGSMSMFELLEIGNK